MSKTILLESITLGSVPSSHADGGGDVGSTGILTGGALSIGTGGAGVATTFTIAAGTGRVVDPTSYPPSVTSVSWSAQTDVAVTDILTQLVTFVAIDSTGAVVQQGSIWTPAQLRTYIPIGVVVHSNQTTVNAVNQAHAPLQSLGNQFADLTLSLGTFNVSGNIFSANGANLRMNKSAGSVFRQGANYTSLTDNPHVVTTAALSPVSLRMQNQTGAGSASTTDIDPDNYDVAGVTTAVPANKFSILRIFLFVSNLVAVQRGQAYYNSLAEAKAAVQTESYTTNSILSANGLLRGFLIVRRGTTDLTSATDAFFLDAGRFGGTAGVGGLSVSTLQNAYDNSSTPEILTDATRLGLTIKRGSGADTDVILEGQNGAGSTTFSVTGAGNVSIIGGSITGITDLAVADGGTGASTAQDARTNLLPSKTGNALKVLRVNAGETDYELSAASGGTNALLDGSAHTDTLAGTVARGDLIVGNSTPKWSRLAIGSANRVLRSDGTDAAWSQVALATDVSGVLDETNGGTGQSTITTGDLLYGSASNVISKLAIGSSGNLLGISSGVPAWVTPGSPGTGTWGVLVKSSDQTGITTSATDVSGLTLSVLNGQIISFRAILMCQTSGTTIGGEVACNGPTASVVFYEVRQWTSTALFSYGQATSFDTFFTATSGPGTTTRPYWVEGTATFTADGTFAIRAKAETASGGTMDVYKGSSLTYSLA